MYRDRRAVSLIIIGWSLTAAVWAGFDRQHGFAVDHLRLLVVGGFLLAGPGLAAVRLMRLTDRLLATVVATGTSLLTLVVAAQASLYTDAWSPPAVVGAIAVLTALLAAAGARRAPAPAAAGPADGEPAAGAP